MAAEYPRVRRRPEGGDFQSGAILAVARRGPYVRQPLRDSRVYVHARLDADGDPALGREDRRAQETVAAGGRVVQRPRRTQQVGPYLGVQGRRRARQYPEGVVQIGSMAARDARVSPQAGEYIRRAGVVLAAALAHAPRSALRRRAERAPAQRGGVMCETRQGCRVLANDWIRPRTDGDGEILHLVQNDTLRAGWLSSGYCAKQMRIMRGRRV